MLNRLPSYPDVTNSPLKSLGLFSHPSRDLGRGAV
jgi:hypothetical protein